MLIPCSSTYHAHQKKEREPDFMFSSECMPQLKSKVGIMFCFQPNTQHYTQRTVQEVSLQSTPSLGKIG